MVLRSRQVCSLSIAHVDLDTAHHLLSALLCSIELFSCGSRQMLLESDRVRVEDTLADGTSLSVRLSESSGLREASDLIHKSQVGALRVGLLSSQALHGCEVTVQATVSISDHPCLRVGIICDRRSWQLLQQLHLLRLRQLRPSIAGDICASIHGAMRCLARLCIQSTVARSGRGSIRHRRALRILTDDCGSQGRDRHSS